MEDGRLVKTIGWSSIYNYDGGEQICDYIYCRTCLVSESVFSVDRVLQLVDSKD